MSKYFYITTTLPYVNAEPHIGAALEFIQADAIARYFRSKLGEENVFFNLGTDEHGLKMFEGAKKEGLTTQEFVDKYAQRFEDFCRLFNVRYDYFYRTSSPEHHESAKKFWEASLAAGDIYKKKYEGLYCIGCEEFKTEKDLVDGKCPAHQTEPMPFSEENYFFRLSKYRNQLLSYFDKNSKVLKPSYKLRELKNWIKNMEDISISRAKENLPWGIEVPGDPTQVMYVWFDALTNFVNVLGYGVDEERLNKWWPGVQVFGPDNLRFQCAIWQGMLASVGLPFSKNFLCHGMILAADGTKMSKTVGNVVSPFVQQEKYGTDTVRFYLLAGLSTFGDAAYKEDDLVALYNSRLANNYGNLLSRVIHLVNKFEIEGDFSADNLKQLERIADPDFVQKVHQIEKEAEEYYEEFELQLAAEKINELAVFGNRYIDETKPWEKDAKNPGQALLNLCYLLHVVTDLYEPIIPESIKKARASLHSREKIILFPKLELLEEKREEVVDIEVISKLPGVPVRSRIINISNLNEDAIKEFVTKELDKLRGQDLERYLEGTVVQGYAQLHSNYNIGEEASCVFLARAFLEDKFPRLNPLVDFYNLFSLTTGFSFGLHDADKIVGNITLKELEQDTKFLPIGAKKNINVPKGKYAAVDDKGTIICFAEVKQSDLTKVTKRTKNILVYVQGNSKTDDTSVKEAMNQFVKKLKEFQRTIS